MSHRLLICSALPLPDDPTLSVDHIDGNPQNNALSNLRWATASEQVLNRTTNNRDGFSKQVEARCDDGTTKIFHSQTSAAGYYDRAVSLTNYKKKHVLICNQGKRWVLKSVEPVTHENEVFKQLTENIMISNFGRLRRRRGQGGVWYDSQPKRHGLGYCAVYVENKRTGIHVAVMLLFGNDEDRRRLTEEPERYVVNHINEDKINNHISNLEVITQAQNMMHSHGNVYLLTNRVTGQQTECVGLKSAATIIGCSQNSVSRYANGHHQNFYYQVDIVERVAEKRQRTMVDVNTKVTVV
jgi:hypothetical protein